MIYNVRKKFVFVHIPRTGGIAITDALLSAFPDSCVDVVDRRHRYGMGVKGLDRLSNLWDNLFKFTFMRNPWDIIESDFKLLLRDVAILHSHSKMELHDRWYHKLHRVKNCKSFSEYVAREYLGRNVIWEGGFWRTWCCNKAGEDLGFKVFFHESIDRDWTVIQNQLEINQPLDRMNNYGTLHFSSKYTPVVFGNLGVEPPKMPNVHIPMPFDITWTPAARDAIGELCYLDVEKFGYEFQGQLAS